MFALALLLALVACTPRDLPVPDYTRRLSGTLAGWSHGSTFEIGYRVENTDGSTRTISNAVAFDGSFDLDFGTHASAATRYLNICGEVLGRGFVFVDELAIFGADGTVRGSAVYTMDASVDPDGHGRQYRFIYSHDMSYDLIHVCQMNDDGETSLVFLRYELEPGWNLVYVSNFINDDGEDVTIHRSSSWPAAGATWTLQMTER
jgi:hypothetical protein